MSFIQYSLGKKGEEDFINSTFTISLLKICYDDPIIITFIRVLEKQEEDHDRLYDAAKGNYEYISEA